MPYCKARCGPFRCQLGSGHELIGHRDDSRHRDWGTSWSFSWFSKNQPESVRGGFFARMFKGRVVDWDRYGCLESQRSFDEADKDEEEWLERHKDTE